LRSLAPAVRRSYDDAIARCADRDSGCAARENQPGKAEQFSMASERRKEIKRRRKRREEVLKARVREARKRKKKRG